MKVAITSENGKTICGHTGECPGFLMYKLNPDQTIDLQYIKLSESQMLKNMQGSISSHPEHPLYGIDAFVTQSMSTWLMERLKKENINVVQTTETEPLNALNALTLTFKDKFEIKEF